MIRVLLFCLGLLAPALAGQVQAQEFRALARLDASASGLRELSWGRVELVLALTQAVPYRVFTLDDPRRVVLDFREVAWETDSPDLGRAEAVSGLRAGASPVAGWSRLVLDLTEPLELRQAGMRTDPSDGSAAIRVLMGRTDAERFAAGAGAPDAAAPTPPAVETGPGRTRQEGNRRLVLALDPGHGGVDPGAQRGGHDEADLMLLFAREFREVLLRTGQFDVVLTRDADLFVPLPERITRARAAGADAFISLHADALAEGRATGATVYTLSHGATDAASAALAESHDRADLLAGVDLSHSDDEVAGVLMDLARLETAPRSDALADALVDGITAAEGALHPRPRLEAGFSVLKAADIPSVLVEVGFLSDAEDLANLLDPAWRARFQGGLADALLDWAVQDAAEAALLRR